MRYIFLTIFLILLSFPGTTWGQQQWGGQVPKELNTDLREAHKSRLAFSPFVGLYVGDTVSTSYIYGIQGAYNLSRHLGVSIEYGKSHLQIDPDGAYGRTVTSRKFYHVNAALMGVVPAAIRFSHHKVTEMDFYAFAGGGFLRINTSKLPNACVGIGTLMYLKPPWFALRTEARSYLYKLPIRLGGMSVDAAILIGPTFLFAPAIF